MSSIRAALIIALVLISPASRAMTILGSGAASCGTWSADRQRNEARSQLNQAWVLGYVTGYNIYKSTQDSVTKPMDTRAMMLWIDNYCDANPDRDIADAAKALIDELTGRAEK
jgi:hypothetical protein